MSYRWFIVVLCLLGAGSLSAQEPVIAFGHRIKVESKIMGETRTLLVRTPPGYDQNQSRYPVVYMTDGPNNFMNTATTAQFLARNHRTPEMIIVAIANTDRTRDLTPTNASVQRPDGGRHHFPTSGGADRFLDFIAGELMPHIDKHYRTEPYKVFAGHSYGGLLVMHAFCNRTELFDAYIASSPSLWWDNQIILGQLEKMLKTKKSLPKTLFVSCGNEGEADANHRLRPTSRHPGDG